MNRKLVSVFFALSFVFFTAHGTHADAAGKKARTTKKTAARSLASVSPVSAEMGQAEQMLYRMKGSPEFVAQKPQVSSTKGVALQGVCRDTYGVLRYSGQKGYSSCVDASTRSSSGASVNDYFGKAQNQAGVAVRLGN